MRIETTTHGLEALSSRIDALQEKVLLALLRLDKADKALKDIRSGLIEIRQIMQSEFIINPAPDGQDPGPDAA